ncbi:PREDICTED: DUF724 domain-containing protein 6-like [Camelina sativa]|uniref:DUF724 domain-containing protein 6-like n=1 Tax=Camelina sativa TaxID=90675 RepID=A0ABM0W150_CAMSA|nr:PREDICTED: DUF724 domain-containing protein 6-like [Camelina sativa]
MMTSDGFWRGGDRVEVERIVSGATAYFPATVVSAPSVRKNHVLVEHEALTVGGSVRMKEYVTPTRLRPSPPRELNRRFKAKDEVDVFRDTEGCWVRGNVTTVLGDSRYIVEFKGGNRPEIEVDQLDMRLHREWQDGSWVPSLQQSNVMESTPQRIKLKIKIKKRENQYEKGALVEVRSEEEVYKGSWYCARILCSLGDDKYIVEHLKFSRDDGESLPLRDVVEAQNMRPVPPPEVSPVVCYEPEDEVDVWFKKRWWIGRVSNVLGGGCKYTVFISRGEEPTVLNFNLRPHKDWINGEWSNPSKSKGECNRPPFKKLKSCERAEMVFKNGMMVEVRSDEPGYEGSWFSAKVISYLGENRYTVEYQTLKTDDEGELLKEEARGSDLRPIPPPLIPKAYRYELHEDVDAWYNEGWWSGQVYTINYNHTRYGVYFKTNNERLEFACNDLRPCQVWRNGKWSRA